MAFYRGMSGYVALGGQLQSSSGVYVNGAKAAGQSTISLDANGGTLVGALAAGDTFTIAGESGSPVHTVVGGPYYLAAGSAIANVNFTPAIATGGVADNAAVTVTSNAVAQITSWSLNATLEELDTTVMGDAWKSVVGGIASWAGQVQVRLDLADPRQAALATKLLAGTPTSLPAALTLGVEKTGVPTVKQFYGAAMLKGVQVPQQMGSIVSATFDFTGSGSLAPQWV